ncbi:Ap3-complex subunit beta-a [Thalictrum thalictroides]|uniref:AP-3 complex subunit beta n=1 Tax=Thalictrum thalictroides TaxID=46969 RepID=A0A7J6VML9_THATH|nr:Ap3-complex subunit beta-a [Thalictrum thalictroides]
MFPQFGATSDSLHKASSAMFRIGTDAHLYDDPEDVNIAPLLDSRYDSEKREAMKRLLALIAQGFDVSNFFPQVVKNVATSSLEVKKLVYLYLLHYAEKRPNEVLLSINCFQKDLSDTNPVVRAWALRAMAGIRLHVISPLVLVAVSKCARDPSVYVRKCAANALPKLHDLNQEENVSTLEEIVGILLSDHSPGVVGAAAAAFSSVCPNNLLLIGRNFRRLCETLPDVEEWGQIILIGILLRYVVAVYGLVKESIMFSSQSSDSGREGVDDHLESNNVSENDRIRVDTSNLTTWLSRCYIEGPDEYLSRSSYMSRDALGLDSPSSTCCKDSEDVRLLLQCTSPLLWSHNSSVVLAAAGVHWIMAPRKDIKRIVKPLLFLLRSFRTSDYVVLCNIQVFAKTMPSLFAPHFEDFFICSSDSYHIKALKLNILSMIATESSISFILQEFQDYIKDPDRRFVADTLAAIGLCAQRLPTTSSTCLEGLLALTRQEYLIGDLSLMDGEEGVLAQAIMSIRAIIKQNPSDHEKAIIQLIRSLDSIKVSAARAMIVWMVGEYNSVGQIIPMMLASVVKYLAGCFTAESLETKHQILSTAVKVVLYAPEGDSSMFKRVLNYVLQLSRCDLDYDIRDRARILEKLLSFHLSTNGVENGELCIPPDMELQHMLAERIFGGKTELALPIPNNFRFYLPGSLSQIVLHAAPGYEPLPRPGSLPHDDIVQQMDTAQDSDSSETSNLDELSGSIDEETSSTNSSRHTMTNSGESDTNSSASGINEEADPLIQLSDVGISCSKHNGSTEVSSSMSFSDDFEGLMSKRALESWLDGKPDMSEVSTSKETLAQLSEGRISLKDIGARVNRKSYTLLDPTYGNGLKAEYSFSSKVSSISQSHIYVELSFENCSTEPLSAITLIDEDSHQSPESTNNASDTYESPSTSNVNPAPSVVPMDEIASLEPSQTTKRTLQVHFPHHLLPLKLVVCCNGKTLPVKLRPDIGYFVKPLQMDVKTFESKESQLPGMFEYTRSCTFTDHIKEINSEEGSLPMSDNLLIVCRTIASKILSNANLFLVSVDMPVTANFDDASGLCFKFSGEILSNSIPCLITITVEGKCSAILNISTKINCEETIFGLNLLNRIVVILS